jgi:hypothetical protein
VFVWKCEINKMYPCFCSILSTINCSCVLLCVAHQFSTMYMRKGNTVEPLITDTAGEGGGGRVCFVHYRGCLLVGGSSSD